MADQLFAQPVMTVRARHCPASLALASAAGIAMAYKLIDAKVVG